MTIRVYIAGATIAHLLPDTASPDDRDSAALCGVKARGSFGLNRQAWLGTASRKEADDAKAMYLCSTCERRGSR